MDNSINFKGAFWLNQPTKTVRNNILSSLGKNQHNKQSLQIFNNFTSEGDVLYISSKNNDKNIAKILMQHKVKFKYYPNLDTKSGFNIQLYDEARKILDGYKSKIITTTSELENVFKINKPSLGFSTKKRDNTLEKTLKTLNLDANDYKIKKLDGFNEIYTKDDELVAIISEPGQYGWRYARLEPQNPNDEIKRLAVRGDQTFTYKNDPDENTENGTTMFLKRYYEAVNANRATTRT